MRHPETTTEAALMALIGYAWIINIQSSNYSPAKPGAIYVSRSKRLKGGADASPAYWAT